MGQIRSARITVNETRDELASARDASTFLLTNRDATDSVYVGDVGVTDTTGYELKAGETLEISLDGEDKAYGVCSAGLVAIVHVLKA